MKKTPIGFALSASFILAGCAAMLTGVRYAGTPEEAPKARFEETPAVTSEKIAGWCEDSGFMAMGWQLDFRSDETVVCSRDYKSRTPNPGGGFSTLIIKEWATFTLTPLDEGGTCVVGSPEVQQDSGGSSGPGAGFGFGVSGERLMGSHTDLEGMLGKLGGDVTPEARAACESAVPREEVP